jgi:hypothetical protein
LKLVDQTRVEWQDRSHVFAIAARAMRQVIIDYARKRHAQSAKAACRSAIAKSRSRRKPRTSSS